MRKVREKSVERYILQACNVAYGPIVAKKDEIKHICKVVTKDFL